MARKQTYVDLLGEYDAAIQAEWKCRAAKRFARLTQRVHGRRDVSGLVLRSAVETYVAFLTREEHAADCYERLRDRYGIDPITLLIIGALINLAIQMLLRWIDNRNAEGHDGESTAAAWRETFLMDQI
jgi:inosine-uridine nucleoside N-ribohydrolase